MIVSIKKIPIFFILAITFFAPSYGMMSTFKERAHKTYENHTVYKQGVKTIDIIVNGMSNVAVWFVHTFHRNDNPTQKEHFLQRYEQMINNRLAQIEKNIRQDEKNAINAIYDEFNISFENRQIIESCIHQFKQFEKEYMSCPHEETVTDAPLDPMYVTLFKKYNIHPNGINVITLASPATENKLRNASASGLKAEIVINDGNITVRKVLSPPTIKLYPRFFSLLSNIEQQSTIAHELCHLIEQHPATQNGLCIGISHFTGKNSTEIVNNKKFQNLHIIWERQAEILHKDAQWASIMREYRNGCHYAGHLFLGHYAQLAEIHALHELKSKINTL
jgi:hypothetical protein